VFADRSGGDRHGVVGRPVPPAFALRVVEIAPGRARAYDEDEWRGALVVVEQGVVQLEWLNGGCRRFGPGSTLAFVGLPLCALRNVGVEPVVLLAVSRRRAVRRHGNTPGS
jgi:hypothetical protein